MTTYTITGRITNQQSELLKGLYLGFTGKTVGMKSEVVEGRDGKRTVQGNNQHSLLSV